MLLCCWPEVQRWRSLGRQSASALGNNVLRPSPPPSLLATVLAESVSLLIGEIKDNRALAGFGELDRDRCALAILNRVTAEIGNEHGSWRDRRDRSASSSYSSSCSSMPPHAGKSTVEVPALGFRNADGPGWGLITPFYLAPGT